MSQLIEIYNIRTDHRLITMIQEASLDKKSYAGLKIENELLFGTKEWFNAIDDGTIPQYVVNGIVSRIYTSGHNDYPEFEILHDENKTVWTKKGEESFYKIGKNIRLTYVEQKFKRPIDIIGPISKCIIKVEIEN